MHVTRIKTEQIFVLKYVHHILSSDKKSQNFELCPLKSQNFEFCPLKSQNFEFCPLSNLYKIEEHFKFSCVLTCACKIHFLALFTFF
jgi:hypothetical protein